MANRPVFISNTNIVGYVEEKKIDFAWFPGLSKSQKQKSIESLHNAFIQEYPGVKVFTKAINNNHTVLILMDIDSIICM